MSIITVLKDSEKTYNKVIRLTLVTSAFTKFILQQNQVYFLNTC